MTVIVIGFHDFRSWLLKIRIRLYQQDWTADIIRQRGTQSVGHVFLNWHRDKLNMYQTQYEIHLIFWIQIFHNLSEGRVTYTTFSPEYDSTSRLSGEETQLLLQTHKNLVHV